MDEYNIWMKPLQEINALSLVCQLKEQLQLWRNFPKPRWREVLKLKKDIVHCTAFVCECMSVIFTVRAPSFNSDWLQDRDAKPVQTHLIDSREKTVCASCFSENVTHVYTHACDKEEVFIPIWAVFNTDRHADRHVHAHKTEEECLGHLQRRASKLLSAALY